MMTQKEQEDYLDRWGTKCLICDAEVDRKDMHLVESIMPLTIYPDHADPQVIKYYMACPECIKAKELI